jgi:hypothetical protein
LQFGRTEEEQAQLDLLKSKVAFNKASIPTIEAERERGQRDLAVIAAKPVTDNIISFLTSQAQILAPGGAAVDAKNAADRVAAFINGATSQQKIGIRAFFASSPLAAQLAESSAGATTSSVSGEPPKFQLLFLAKIHALLTGGPVPVFDEERAAKAVAAEVKTFKKAHDPEFHPHSGIGAPFPRRK